jgi:hypothetical protein
MAWHGMAWHGMAWRGMARHGMVCNGEAWAHAKGNGNGKGKGNSKARRGFAGLDSHVLPFKDAAQRSLGARWRGLADDIVRLAPCHRDRAASSCCPCAQPGMDHTEMRAGHVHACACVSVHV